MTEVVLSRRNLVALLSKLDEPGSACTIIKPDGTVVHAVEDGEVYVDRPPGEMHMNTELALEVARLRAAIQAVVDVDHGVAWPDLLHALVGPKAR
jgi:hypothetical protein